MKQLTYPNKEILTDWSKLIKLTEKEVQDIHNQWLDIGKQNEEIRNSNNKAKQEKLSKIKEVLAENGIDIYKYKNKGFLKVKSGYQSWFEKNVYSQIDSYEHLNSYPYVGSSSQTIDNIKLYCNSSPTNIIELHNKIIYQYNSEKYKQSLNNDILIKSIKYATDNDINIENLSTDEIVVQVTEIAKDRYEKDNYTSGQLLNLDDNYCDCGTYYYASHRCSCGNRRCYLEIKGNLVDGFYGEVEAY